MPPRMSTRSSQKASCADATPIEPTPTKAATAKQASTKATPTKAASMKSAATKASPAKSAATKASPAKSAATKASPAKSAATKASPAKSAATKATPTKSATKPVNAASITSPQKAVAMANLSPDPSPIPDPKTPKPVRVSPHKPMGDPVPAPNFNRSSDEDPDVSLVDTDLDDSSPTPTPARPTQAVNRARPAKGTSVSQEVTAELATSALDPFEDSSSRAIGKRKRTATLSLPLPPKKLPAAKKPRVPINLDSDEDEAIIVLDSCQSFEDYCNIAPFIPLLQQHYINLSNAGILKEIFVAEFRPRFTENVDTATLPHLQRIGWMKNASQTVYLYDAIVARNHGPYTNPLNSSPGVLNFQSNKALIAQPGPCKGYPAVLFIPAAIMNSNLKQAVPVYPNATSEHRRLHAYLFEDVKEHFASFVGTVLGQSTILTYGSKGALQFSTRSSLTGSPMKPSTPAPKRSQLNMRYPHVRNPNDEIRILDGRRSDNLGRPGFRFTESDWANLWSLPPYRLGEIPPYQENNFVVAIVGFTLGAYLPADNSTDGILQASFNLMFVIVIGNYLSDPASPDPDMDLETIDLMRAQVDPEPTDSEVWPPKDSDDDPLTLTYPDDEESEPAALEDLINDEAEEVADDVEDDAVTEEETWDIEGDAVDED